MIREPRRSTLTDTRCPYTTLLRSVLQGARTGDAGVAGGHRRAFDEGCAGTAAGGPDTRCFPQRRGSARCVCLQPFRRAGGAACGCDCRYVEPAPPGTTARRAAGPGEDRKVVV